MRWSRPAAVSVMLALWAFFIGAGTLHAEHQRDPGSEVLQGLAVNGGYMLTRDGKALVRFNENKLFVPASTIKIATALAALELLGPDRRIKTEFFLRNDTTLCIKGYGDPYLISERVDEIALNLKERGVSRLEKIIIDDHYFALDGPADGSENSDNPYDVANGALAVNFNSVSLTRLADGTIISPEPQTPLLSITEEIGALVATGTHRVNVSAFTKNNPAITPLRYGAELFARMLRRHGVVVAGAYGRGSVDRRDRLIYTYSSKATLADMVRGCLAHSNNFIANQIFLYVGALRFGEPATWEKGRRAVSEMLAARIDEQRFTIAEGSGLSRNNRISPAAMITILESFKPYAGLLPDRDNILLKSGTLSGVYGYGGYFSSGDRLDPFVILLNQPSNHRDRLLRQLAKRYHDQRENP